MVRLAREDVLGCAQHDPARAAEDREVLAAAQQALASLPDRQRAVFDLVDVQGYAPQDAAALLGISPPTARTHLLRARRALRAALVDLQPGEHE